MSRLLRHFVGLTATLALVALAGCPAPIPTGDDAARTPPIVAEDDWNDKGDSTTGLGTYLLCFWNVENFFDDQDDDLEDGDVG